MTTSKDLLDVVVAAVSAPGATDAGARAYRPADWPTQSGQYPILKLRVVRETKRSLGRGGGPQFTVVTTLRIIGEVSEPVQVNDAGAAAAEGSLWALQRQVEIAVIGSYPLEAMTEQIAAIDSQLSYSAEAETHLAGIQIDLALEFYQGPEDFAPIASDAVEELAATPYGDGHLGFTLQNLQQ